MKKLTLFLLLLLSAISFNTAGQTYSKDCYTFAKKAAKSEAKELARGKYISVSNANPVELLTHYYLLTGLCGQYQAYSATSMADNLSTGEEETEQLATQEIALQIIMSAREGGVDETSLMFSAESDIETTIHIEPYARSLASLCLERYCTFYRVRKDDQLDVRVLFLINKKKLERVISIYAAKRG